METVIASEDDHYHSTTELEWSVQPTNDSDVEIIKYGHDGSILSGISEYDDEPIDHDMIGLGNYRFFDEDPASNSYFRHLCDDEPHSAHLYIQKKQSSSVPFINNMIFYDEYFSFKYFYELTLPLSVELMLLFGVFLFNSVSVLIIITVTCIIFKNIQLMIFQFVACIASFVLLRILCYFKVLPPRSMPNVINNMDPYGYNLKRSINLRQLWYKNSDKNVSSFPCSTVCNVTIYSLSCYLYSHHLLILLLIPYVIMSRCYFAFNHLLDCVFSLLFGLCLVAIAMYLIPQSFLIISDEIIREIPLNIFS